MLLERLSKVSGHDVSRETVERIDHYVALLLDENAKQNLISKSSEDVLLERHIVDSAQLLGAVGANKISSWVDIGTGPGLPGIVLSILAPGRYLLVEPRPLRIQFLEHVVSELRLGDRVKLLQGKAAAAKGKYDVITGRAVASIDRFLSLSQHLSTEKSIWLLPKGRKALEELEDARRFWHLDASVLPSATDDDASIIRVTHAERKKRGGKR